MKASESEGPEAAVSGEGAVQAASGKKRYSPPSLSRYGAVQLVTGSGKIQSFLDKDGTYTSNKPPMM